MYDKVCKSCGTRYSEFLKTSMLGCPDCYKAFNSEIISALGKFQHDTFHTGKNPNFSEEDNDLLYKYKILLKDEEIAKSQGTEKIGLSEEIRRLAEELKARGIM